MKTIYTTLPVYDSLAKQCYERVKKSGLDKMVPVVCPRHRLPSFQWNSETDNPGEIDNIKLMNTDGVNVFDQTLALTNGTYDTYTVSASGTGVTVVDAGPGIQYGRLSGNFDADKRKLYVLTVTLAYTSGDYPIVELRNATTHVRNSNSYQELRVGINKIYFTTLYSESTYYAVFTSGATSYILSNASIRESFMEYFSPEFDMIVYDAFSGVDTAYDTHTEETDYRRLTLAKTTAAVRCGYIFHDIQIEADGIAIGDKVYIETYLTLNSGTAPRMALVEQGGGRAVLSNTVQLTAGRNIIVLTATAANANGEVEMWNQIGELANFIVIFNCMYRSVMPSIYTPVTDDYFQYKGETLAFLLPEGEYYLQIETLNARVYYSDWFRVDCVYENILTDPDEVLNTYDTMTLSGTAILSAINAAGSADVYSNLFPIRKGEVFTAIFYLSRTSGEYPSVLLSGSWSNTVVTVPGLNVITLTVTGTGAVPAFASLRFTNAGAANFQTTEIYLMRGYSTKYLVLNFSNVCDLGEILYSGGFEQTAWLESETMEPSFPQEEEGVKNGEGRFVRSFARQVKKYLVRTNAMPDFMVDVFHRMKLHDTVEIIDLVGDVNDVYNLEVEHEWLGDDKYYAKLELAFDYNEAIAIGGCCNNVS